MVVGDFANEVDTLVIGSGPGGVCCGDSCGATRTKSNNR